MGRRLPFQFHKAPHLFISGISAKKRSVSEIRRRIIFLLQRFTPAAFRHKPMNSADALKQAPNARPCFCLPEPQNSNPAPGGPAGPEFPSIPERVDAPAIPAKPPPSFPKKGPRRLRLLLQVKLCFRRAKVPPPERAIAVPQ